MINVGNGPSEKDNLCHIPTIFHTAKKLFPLVKKELHLKTPEESDVFEF
jgi:hypothetical protein